MTPAGWRVASSFLSTGEAELAASALEAAGIDCLLGDQNLVGVNLLVHEEDVEHAKEIMAAPAAESVAVCPECGSPDFQRVPRTRLFLLLAAIFIGIGVAVDQQVLAMTALIAVAIGVVLMPPARCTRCLHRWSPPARREAPPLPDPADTIEHPCPRCGSLEVYDQGYPIIGPRCDECGSAMRVKK